MIRCAPRICVSEPLSKQVEPVESEILELRLVCEEEILHISNAGSDCLIVVDNNWVIDLGDNCEERGNLLHIIFKFFLSVREDKDDCFRVNSKCLQPVS